MTPGQGTSVDEEALRALSLARLRSGDVPGAERALKRALALAPRSDAALRAWCELLAATQAWPHLVDWAERSIRVTPHPASRYQLAFGLFRVDAYEEGLSVLRRLLADLPAEASPWMLLAEGEESGGRSDASGLAYRRGLAIAADNPDVLRTAASFFVRTGASSDLLAIARRRPDHHEAADWLMQAGLLAARRGRGEEAITAMRRHASLFPGLGAAYGFLGEASREIDPDSALTWALRFVATDPVAPEAHGTLALAYRVAHRLVLTRSALKRALAINPSYLSALINLSQLQMMDTRPVEAERLARRAFAVEAPTPIVHWNLGQILLGQGKPDPGLYHEEYRLHDGSDPSRVMTRILRPRWDGQPLDGRSLLIWSERGIGDQFYYARWMAMLPKTIGRVIVECDERLVSLYQRSFPHLHVVAWRAAIEDMTAEPIDLQIPVGSLPLIYMRETGEAIEALRRGAPWPPQPFFRADPDRVAYWDSILSDRPGRLRVAISWRSGVLSPTRNLYYLSVDEFIATFRGLPVTVVNAQYNATEAELDRLRACLDDLYLPSIDLKNDLDDVSALLTSCDLVVAPGVAVSNLAAGLGVPTWCCTFGRDWMTPDFDRHPLFLNFTCFSRGLTDGWPDVAAQMRARLVAHLQEPGPRTSTTPHLPSLRR